MPELGTLVHLLVSRQGQHLLANWQLGLSQALSHPPGSDQSPSNLPLHACP